MTSQGILYFDTPSLEQLLAVLDGVFWSFDNTNWTPNAGWTPTSDDTRIAMVQGINTVLISDTQAALVIYDGTNFTVCGTTPNDPPVGASILTWHTGRMFAAGIASLSDTIFVSNRLAFGTGQWNSATRSFRIGFGDGDPIVAMASMQDYTLCVLKQNSIWLVATNPLNEPANFSADQGYAALSQGFGCVGRDAWCAYQNDVLFMSQDGVRSVQRMQAAAGQWQLSAPISQPIQPYIDRINRSAWSKICAKKYQEFAFFFVPLDNSTTNNTVLVWNGRLGRWSGIFTGWNGECLEVTRFGGINRLVFGDTQGSVQRWKDYQSATEDTTYTDNGVGYASKEWSRGFLFGNPNVNKDGYSSVIAFSAGKADVTMTWMADNVAVRTWVGAPEPSGSILGGDDLLGETFTLASTSTINVRRNLRNLKAFNESFVRIESETGWWALRSITVSAFLNPMTG